MKFLFTALIALLCTTAFAQGGSPKSVHTDIIDKQVIPQDSAVRKGMLDNGMTYYVAKCQYPEKRAYCSRGQSISLALKAFILFYADMVCR